jgi:hypothetical protein
MGTTEDLARFIARRLRRPRRGRAAARRALTASLTCWPLGRSRCPDVSAYLELGGTCLQRHRPRLQETLNAAPSTVSRSLPDFEP